MFKRKKQINALDLLKEINDYKRSQESSGNKTDIYEPRRRENNLYESLFIRLRGLFVSCLYSCKIRILCYNFTNGKGVKR